MSEGLTSAQRSLARGLLAGLVAGLAATAVKTLAEKYYPPRVHGEPDPCEVLAERLAGHRMDADTRESAATTIRWTFGALTGAAYGALAEFYPAATARDGASFGLALMSLTHEGALPAMGLEAPVEEQSGREKASEAASHILFGVVAEKVRGWVRPLLD